MIRMANSEDAGPIAAIYNYFVENTVISFEEEAVSDTEMAARIEALHADGLPWLVMEQDGAVVGYAYATKWRARRAYRHAVESSVYVDHRCPRQGIGARLYEALVIALRERALHAVIGGIALPNAASVALHEKFGFEKVAHFKEVGFKQGRWVDVGYWQLTLYRGAMHA